VVTRELKHQFFSGIWLVGLDLLGYC